MLRHFVHFRVSSSSLDMAAEIGERERESLVRDLISLQPLSGFDVQLALPFGGIQKGRPPHRL